MNQWYLDMPPEYSNFCDIRCFLHLEDQLGKLETAIRTRKKYKILSVNTFIQSIYSMFSACLPSEIFAIYNLYLGNIDRYWLLPLIILTILSTAALVVLIFTIVELFYNVYNNHALSKEIQQIKIALDQNKNTTLQWNIIKKNLIQQKSILQILPFFSCALFFLGIGSYFVTDYMYYNMHFHHDHYSFSAKRFLTERFSISASFILFAIVVQLYFLFQCAQIDKKLTAATQHNKNDFLALEYGRNWTSVTDEHTDEQATTETDHKNTSIQLTTLKV